ncbi:MAG: hydroxymethylbilane synthase [Elusimicrobiota bacterium]
MKQNKIIIGSRSSLLASTQTKWVVKELNKYFPDLQIEIKWISTQGDRLSEAGTQGSLGKGIFVKDIEQALLNKEIDLAVHSLKDVPQELPDGLILGPFPKRENPNDVFISRFGELLEELPKGSTIGTSSPRRRAQILFHYKKRQYRVENIRGNVDTRLKKLQDGKFDGIILAQAGLNRLGLQSEITQVIEPSVLLPAPCQGCLGLELRMNDQTIFDFISVLKDPISDITARAERAFLQGVGGDCYVPLGCLAKIDQESLHMDAVVLDVDGTKRILTDHSGSVHTPELVGAECAEKLLFVGGSEILMGNRVK